MTCERQFLLPTKTTNLSRKALAQEAVLATPPYGGVGLALFLCPLVGVVGAALVGAPFFIALSWPFPQLRRSGGAPSDTRRFEFPRPLVGEWTANFERART